MAKKTKIIYLYDEPDDPDDVDFVPLEDDEAEEHGFGVVDATELKHKSIFDLKQFPVTAPVHCGKKNCNCEFQLHSKREIFVYDVGFPFRATADYFYCSTHEKHCFGDVATVVNLGAKYKCSVEFYYEVASLYTQFLNYSKVRDALICIWRSRILSKAEDYLEIEKNQIERQVVADQLTKALYISITFIKRIICHWSGKHLFKTVQSLHWKQGTDILRADHTFKATSTLGGWIHDKKIMKKVSAQLLTVADHEGKWIEAKIVPDTSLSHVTNFLEEYWSKSSKPTKVFYTDYDTAHAQTIKRCFKGFFKNEPEIKVGQDRWHSIQRIARALPISHPDRNSCLEELRRIFNLLNPSKKLTVAQSKKRFFEKIEAWNSKYSALKYCDSLSFDEQVDMLNFWYKEDEENKENQPVDTNTYEILRILGEKQMENKTHFLCQFKGYDLSQCEWIPEDKTDCDLAIKIFRSNTKNKSKPILQTKEIQKKINLMKKNKGILVALELNHSVKQGTSYNESLHAYITKFLLCNCWAGLETLQMQLLILLNRWNTTLRTDSFDRLNLLIQRKFYFFELNLENPETHYFISLKRDHYSDLIIMSSLFYLQIFTGFLLETMIATAAQINNRIQNFWKDKVLRNSTFDQLLLAGFKPKVITEQYLCPVDKRILEETLKNWHTIDTNCVKNKLYYIQHYIFDNRVTQEQIKNTMRRKLQVCKFFLVTKIER